MSQRLSRIVNMPVLANFRIRDLLMFFFAAALVYAIFGRSPLGSMQHNNASTASKKAFIGVINGQGEWIIPPRYLQIIYMRKTDSFWVKVRESDVAKTLIWDAIHSIGGNTAWKLLDRNGAELKSHLPYLAEPVCAEMTNFGASIHSDILVVRKNNENGYCEPDGRPITGCKYSFICDAGHGIWLAAETKKDLGDQPMPIVLLDHHGTKLRTLDSGINYINYAGNGVLECTRRHQRGYVDYRGEFIPLAVNEQSPGLFGAETLRGQRVAYKHLAHYPESSSKPVKWVDLAKHPEMSNDVFQVTFVDNRAVIECAGKSGLVDINGNWLLQPTFNGLLYCTKDRLIAHNKQRTADEIQIDRYEHIGSLTGF